MADKKTYYQLDEIGFVGIQDKTSAMQKIANVKKTTEIINKHKSGKVSSTPHILITKISR